MLTSNNNASSDINAIGDDQSDNNDEDSQLLFNIRSWNLKGHELIDWTMTVPAYYTQSSFCMQFIFTKCSDMWF